MIKSRLLVLIAEREIRDGRKWSYENLKQATGLSVTTLHRMARNRAKMYSANTLDVLCDFFGCGVGDLLEHIPDGGEDEQERTATQGLARSGP